MHISYCVTDDFKAMLPLRAKKQTNKQTNKIKKKKFMLHIIKITFKIKLTDKPCQIMCNCFTIIFSTISLQIVTSMRQLQSKRI